MSEPDAETRHFSEKMYCRYATRTAHGKQFSLKLMVRMERRVHVDVGYLIT